MPTWVRSHLAAFTIPPSALEARAHLTQWVTLLESAHGKQLNEKELLPDFLTDLLGSSAQARAP